MHSSRQLTEFPNYFLRWTGWAVTSNTRYGWNTNYTHTRRRRGWTLDTNRFDSVANTANSNDNKSASLKIFMALDGRKADIARIWPSDNMHKLFIHCCCGCAAHSRASTVSGDWRKRLKCFVVCGCTRYFYDEKCARRFDRRAYSNSIRTD